MIDVRDDGTGMPPEVAARAINASFITKGVGKGTGLVGPSRIYGMAQAGGAARRGARRVLRTPWTLKELDSALRDATCRASEKSSA